MPQFTDQDLEDITMACRGQAHIARRDAAAGGSAADVHTRKAERLEKLAARFQAELDRRRGVG
jgi:hypothetical protein